MSDISDARLDIVCSIVERSIKDMGGEAWSARARSEVEGSLRDGPVKTFFEAAT